MILGMIVGVGIFVSGFLCGHYRGYIVAKTFYEIKSDQPPRRGK